MPIVETDPMFGLTHELQYVFASVPSLPTSGVTSASFYRWLDLSGRVSLTAYLSDSKEEKICRAKLL